MNKKQIPTKINLSLIKTDTLKWALYANKNNYSEKLKAAIALELASRI